MKYLLFIFAVPSLIILNINCYAETNLSLEDQYEMLTAKEERILSEMRREVTRPSSDESEDLPENVVRADLNESNERLAALEERIMNLLAVAEAEESERAEMDKQIDLPENSVLHFGEIEIRKDMPIATISTLGGNMYSRSADPDSFMASLSPGSMLAVEFRLGDWYRIVTPYGERGWVKSSDLLFGPSARSYPTEIVKIKGYIR